MLRLVMLSLLFLLLSLFVLWWRHLWELKQHIDSFWMRLSLRLLLWEWILLSIGVLFHLLHPLILDGYLWQCVTKRRSRVRELLCLGEEQIYAAFLSRGRVESWEKRWYIYIYVYIYIFLYVYLFLFFCSCFTNMICCVNTLMVSMMFIIWCLIHYYVLWIQFQFLVFDLHSIFHTCIYSLFLVF